MLVSIFAVMVVMVLDFYLYYSIKEKKITQLLNNKELENICFFGFIYITYKNGKVNTFIDKILHGTDIFERNAVERTDNPVAVQGEEKEGWDIATSEINIFQP